MQASPDPAESHWLIDLSARAKLRLTGADRLRFLNGQVSNDVRRATAEQSVYACVMTIKGKMCADVFIHAEGESLLVDAEGELRESLAARLERYIIADDVQLEDATEEIALWHVLASVPDAPAPELPALFVDLKPGVQTVCSSRYGRPGFDLFFAVALAGEVRSRLSSAGGFREPDAEELETLRIRAGAPRWGAELNENTMPAEADLEARAVDYAKGCYIGQEIVSRIKSVGHVNRSLCGLRAVDPRANLIAGMLLYPIDAAEPPTREAGRITSATQSIALGYVRRGWETAGSLLDAVVPDSASPNRASSCASCRVEVCPLPFPS
jgi:folate-binding protein YgfZ